LKPLAKAALPIAGVSLGAFVGGAERITTALLGLTPRLYAVACFAGSKRRR